MAAKRPLRPEHAFVAAHGQHDRHGVGAREVLGVAGRAFAPPAGRRGRWWAGRNGRRSGGAGASRAGSWPARGAPSVSWRQQSLHRQRAQVDGDERVAALVESGVRASSPCRTTGVVAVDAEERRLAHRAEAGRLVDREQGVEHVSPVWRSSGMSPAMTIARGRRGGEGRPCAPCRRGARRAGRACSRHSRAGRTVRGVLDRSWRAELPAQGWPRPAAMRAITDSRSSGA